MVAIMGTSICHILLGRETADVEGMCGVVEDGVVPGLYGFEAGQSAVGDIFGWFVENCVPPEDHEAARRRGLGLHEYLEEAAGRLAPGESGLLALDWWNGNRSVLVDAELGGLLVGLTLQTRAPEIYRALIEATAFGTRVIVDAFRSAGVAVDRMVACGGLPERNKLLDPDLRRRDGARARRPGLEADPCSRRRHVRSGRGRGRGGRVRLDRRRLTGDGSPER